MRGFFLLSFLWNVGRLDFDETFTDTFHWIRHLVSSNAKGIVFLGPENILSIFVFNRMMGRWCTLGKPFHRGSNSYVPILYKSPTLEMRGANIQHTDPQAPIWTHRFYMIWYKTTLAWESAQLTRNVLRYLPILGWWVFVVDVTRGERRTFL